VKSSFKLPFQGNLFPLAGPQTHSLSTLRIQGTHDFKWLFLLFLHYICNTAEHTFAMCHCLIIG
jgi:hypothetical protein